MNSLQFIDFSPLHPIRDDQRTNERRNIQTDRQTNPKLINYIFDEKELK